MELTKTVKDKTFDDYFTEADHSESISEDRPGSCAFFTSISEVGKSFLEEKLQAYKLLSKIELSTDAAQYMSEADGIHFLCADGTSGSYNQMVFGASNIVGEI